MDDLTSHYDQKQFYVKKKVHPDISYRREVKIYKLVEGLNIALKLIEHGVIHHEEGHRDWYATYIVTERYGVSLLNKYFDKHERGLFDGPGTGSSNALNNPDLFEEMFPSTRLSDDIRKQIQAILRKLEAIGLVHEDIHAGNFLIDDSGIVKIIDFECVLIKNDD